MEQEHKEKQPACSSAPAPGYATDSHDKVVRKDGSVVGECRTHTDANQVACELNTMLRVNEDLRDIIAAESRELRAMCTARDDALAEARRLREKVDHMWKVHADDSAKLRQYCAELDEFAAEVSRVKSHNDEAERTAIAETARQPGI